MKFLALTHRLNTRWYAVVTAVAFIVVTVFIVWPTLADISELRDTVIEEQRKLEESYQRGQSLRRAQESVAGIQSGLGLIEAATLRPGQELEFITKLERAAGSYGLVQTITMDDLLPSVARLTALPVRVNLSGSFPNIIRYLDAIERQSFYVNWEVVNVGSDSAQVSRRRFGQAAPNSVSSAESKSSISIDLSGSSFWRPLVE